MSAWAARLPAYQTRFVGREREIDKLHACLADHHVVTICGVGGSGKTRLALETVRRWPDDMAGVREVCWVTLADVHDADLVRPAVGDAVGEPGATPARLRDALAGRTLVLDECEQVVAGCRDLITVLQTESELRVLLTSRVPLGLAGERVYAIPPLDLDSAALELFADRAALVAPVYTLTPANRAPIAAICARLDGLPLGIELAASRIGVLAPRDLLAELDTSLDVLASTGPTLDGRHRSIEAVLDASWHALGEDERDVLAGLATFAGGFTTAAAEAVAGARVEQLNALLDRGLVQAIVTEGDQVPRYQLHELVRSYVAGRVAADHAVADSWRLRHFDYCLELSRESLPRWNGNASMSPRDSLWEDRANLDAAMRWAVDRGDSDRALRLVGALYSFWNYSWPSLATKRHRLAQALALPWAPSDRASILARARALVALGFSWTTGDPALARRTFTEALQWYQQLGHRSGTAWAYSALAWQSLVDGDLAAAARHERESLARFRAIGHRAGEAGCVSDLGQIAIAAGRWDEAEAEIRRSMAMADELDDEFLRYRGHLMLADLRRFTGRWREAVGEYQQALQLQRANGFTAHGADILEGLGETAAQLGDVGLAADLLAAGLAWRRQYEVPRGSFHDAGQAAAVGQVLSSLGPDAWHAALAAAELLPGDELVAVAESGIARVLTTLDRRQCGLSEREAEVLRLVAQGLGNADIADQLGVSPRTVAAHLRSIFGKLHVTTRTAAAREAVRLCLL